MYVLLSSCKRKDDEHILEEYSKELYQTEAENSCYNEDINEKVRENERQLVIKLLREGYSVDKICNMLGLTHSKIEEIVNSEEF